MGYLDNVGLAHFWAKCRAAFAAKTHTHNYAGSSSAGGAATTALACTGNSATASGLVTYKTLGAGNEQYKNQYTKVASITMTNPYYGYSGLIAVQERGEYEGYGLLSVRVRVGNSTTLSDINIIEWVALGGAMVNKPNDFMLVYTAPTYEIWVKPSTNWDCYWLTPLQQTYAQLLMTFYDTQPYQTVAPSGTIVYASIAKLPNNIGGNADTATVAAKDGAGQQISSTYVKGLAVSGRTVTYTKGNGATGTISLPDFVGVSASRQTGAPGLVPAPPGSEYGTGDGQIIIPADGPDTNPMVLMATGEWGSMQHASADSAGLMSAADKNKLDTYAEMDDSARWVLLWSGDWGADGSAPLAVSGLSDYMTIALRDKNGTISLGYVGGARPTQELTFSTYFPQSLANGGLSIRRHRISTGGSLATVNVLTLLTSQVTTMTAAGVWSNGAYATNTIAAIYGVK